MKCQRCNESFTQDEADRVSDTFDFDNLCLCFPCAEDVWQERQQETTFSDSCQDEGD